MRSTFHGLETARRAMTTQQAALLTTGHNIANANTPGYTRQRVNLQTTEPYPAASLNRPQIPGQIGSGVKVGDVQRIRDSFTDMQLRNETSKLGYWESRAEQLSQMESIMNEPSQTGLASSIDQFWNSLQDLASQPQNNGARRVVRQRGIALADTFNYLSSSLQAVQKNFRNEIKDSEHNVNSVLRQINMLNKQISDVEPHGLLPNDLYDERDRLLDELSTMVNIKVESKSSSGHTSPNAEGLVNIYLASPQGDILLDENSKPIKLIDSETNKAIGFHIQYENRLELGSPVTSIKFFELDAEAGFKGLTEAQADESNAAVYQLTDVTKFNTNGKLRGYMEGYGYKTSEGKVEGLFNRMLSDLDTMAYTFVTEFNKVHQSGWSPIEIRTETDTQQNFFTLPEGVKGAAANIKVADKILEDVDYIAAAQKTVDEVAYIGNGTNALALADVKDAVLNYGGNQTNLQTFYQGMIGTLGDNASQANRMSEVAGVLKDSLNQQRMSTSSVSLDEEMTDMIKFQHAYNAAARNITLIDEMLDKIINGMGVGGR
ncbi:flagellar hook-associated protein FlgK [Niallia endozanthoxylica]|uniref:Flagellar hook-associated protein 1 n=1 Tax=Niallia endozanthoxylica TaxID=2036016 RepID=A0A5J5HPZ9_9BACI|nr:flagellar hook-associated protein FlgK [Niallia endozanthoxylica]KAA9022055.1 flagellar hook-associated protein FlgK [Niallia endozanthoxylica]